LYTINVYQPCSRAQILRMLREVGSGERVPKTDKSHAFISSVNWLLERNYIAKTPQYEYTATFKGLRFLSKQRLAFPRDKFRLYSLHDLLKKRRDQ